MTTLEYGIPVNANTDPASDPACEMETGNDLEYMGAAGDVVWVRVVGPWQRVRS